MKTNFVSKLKDQVRQLDELKKESTNLFMAGAFSERQHNELQDVLNDVAIGVDDLAARLSG